MKRSKWVVRALVVAGVPSIATAQTLKKCVAGQEVTDKEGKTGVIVSGDSKLCQVKYADGQIYGWIFWNLRPAAAAGTSGLQPSGADPPDPVETRPPSSAPSTTSAAAPTVLKPPSSRILVYRADRRGHFTVTATVNGVPIRLVVDTGASLVALTLDDARAAGFDRSGL